MHQFTFLRHLGAVQEAETEAIAYREWEGELEELRELLPLLEVRTKLAAQLADHLFGARPSGSS